MPENGAIRELARRVNRVVRPMDDERREVQLRVLQAELRRQAQTRPVARKRMRRWVAGLAAAALAAVTVVGLLVAQDPRVASIDPPRGFLVHTGATVRAGRPGHWITVEARKQRRLEFDGGSRVELAGNTRLQVERSRYTEVRIMLARGELRATVRRAAGSRFIVDAGGYRVHVVGTRFTVRWDPDQSELTVAVTEGKVRVTGRLLAREGIMVEAGRQLKATEVRAVVERSSRPETSMGSGTPQEDIALMPLAPTHRGAWPRDAEPNGRQAAIAKALRRSRLRDKRWERLLNQGQYARVITEAAGVSVQRLSPRALWSLAHAYRYTSQASRAIRTLTLYRARASTPTRRSRAAFVLGRIYMDNRRNLVSACDWFSRYWTENPRGELAREAVGRIIVACGKAGRKSRATRAALEYLKRFPSGPHRAVARAQLQAAPQERPDLRPMKRSRK